MIDCGHGFGFLRFRGGLFLAGALLEFSMVHLPSRFFRWIGGTEGGTEGGSEGFGSGCGHQQAIRRILGESATI